MSYIFLLENLPQLNYLSFRSTIPMVKLIKLSGMRLQSSTATLKAILKTTYGEVETSASTELSALFVAHDSPWLLFYLDDANNIEQHCFSNVVFASWLAFRIPHMLNFVLLLGFANLTSFSIACIILNIVYIRLFTILFV